MYRLISIQSSSQGCRCIYTGATLREVSWTGHGVGVRRYRWRCRVSFSFPFLSFHHMHVFTAAWHQHLNSSRFREVFVNLDTVRLFAHFRVFLMFLFRINHVVSCLLFLFLIFDSWKVDYIILFDWFDVPWKLPLSLCCDKEVYFDQYLGNLIKGVLRAF